MLSTMAGFRDLVGRAMQAALDLLSKQDGQERGRSDRRGRGGPRPGSAPERGVRTLPSSDRARHITYAPDMDGAADPGEIVWTWVPYEEDASQGKDRPVLLIGRKVIDGADNWAGLMLTSKDHDRDAEDEARHGRHWMDIGAGAWDAERRPSEVRLYRLIILRDDAIRREGAAVSREVFDRVVAEARRYHAVD